MLKYSDRSLFRNDFIFEYRMAVTPEGYKLLYRLGSWLLDARAFSKVLSYSLALATVALVGLTANRLAGSVAGWAAVAILLAGDYLLARTSGGLPRSFACAFVAFSIYMAVTARPFPFAVSVPVAASIYPPAAVLAGLSLAFYLLLPMRWSGVSARWSVSSRLLLLGLCAGLALLVIGLRQMALEPYGPMISAHNEADIKAYPEKLGRHPATGLRTVSWFGVIERSLAWETAKDRFRLLSDDYARIVLLGVLAVVVLALVMSREPACIRFLVVAAAGPVAYLFAVGLYPMLYYPTRYIYAAVVLAVAIPVGIVRASRPLDRIYASRWSIDHHVIVGTALFLLAFGALGPTRSAGFRSVRVPEEHQPLYQYLETLPKDILVAGWPTSAVDNVPYLSGRSILVSHEMHVVFYRRYADEMRRRANALIDAYLAVDAAPVLHLHREFGVTHLIVEPSKLGGYPEYFDPFTQRIKALQEATAGQPKLFARLLNGPHAARFADGEIVLIDLSEWAASR
jgi:hypothetical protein